MHAERVNGYDPLPVIDAFRRKKQILLEGRGPVLLDTVTYRISGHSPSDASSYRSKEEIERWQQADSIRAFREQAARRAAWSPKHALDSARACVEADDLRHVPAGRPIWKPARAWPSIPSWSGSVMFSNRRVEKFDDRQPEFLQELGGQSARAADPRQDPHPDARRQARARR